MKGKKPYKSLILLLSLSIAVVGCGFVLGELAITEYQQAYGKGIPEKGSLIKTPEIINTVVGSDEFSLKTVADDVVISYTSDNPAVASVDENGTVTIEGKGSATIKAFSTGGLTHLPGFSETEVNVEAIGAPKITDSRPGVRSTQLQWSKVKRAEGYIVREYDSSGELNDTVEISPDENFVEFSDKMIGYTYSYEVTAFTTADGKKYESKPSERVSETTRDALLGQARNDENKNTRGGKAGDQTGKEVAIGKWSAGSSGWNNWAYVARFKDPEKARKAADTMEAACKNDHIGYDQSSRTSLYSYAQAADWDVESITANCECSCSPLVSVCINAAGVSVPAGWWTGNRSMKSAMEATGEFEFFTDSSYTNSTKKLKRGDILVTPNRHTGMVL